MYNGIGLTTPRGSGTNGHVQRNWAFVRPSKKDTNYRNEEDVKKLDATLNKPPNKDILDHDRKRKMEVKCIEFEEILEKQGYAPDEIKSKVDSYRQKLMGQSKTDLPKDEFGRIAVRETHQIAAAQQQKNAKLREAFNISEYFVEGSSFDSDRKAKEDLAKSLSLQKELDAQRAKIAGQNLASDCTMVTAETVKTIDDRKKRYNVGRNDDNDGCGDAGSESISNTTTNIKTMSSDDQHLNKKKKKKRTHESSASPERKKDKKKKSKKHKKENKLKRKKSRKRKSSITESEALNSDNDNDDNDVGNCSGTVRVVNDDDSSMSESNIKKSTRSKRIKKDKKKHSKKRKKDRHSSSISDRSINNISERLRHESKKDISKKEENSSRNVKASKSVGKRLSREKTTQSRLSQDKHSSRSNNRKYATSPSVRRSRSRSHDGFSREERYDKCKSPERYNRDRRQGNHNRENSYKRRSRSHQRRRRDESLERHKNYQRKYSRERSVSYRKENHYTQRKRHHSSSLSPQYKVNVEKENRIKRDRNKEFTRHKSRSHSRTRFSRHDREDNAKNRVRCITRSLSRSQSHSHSRKIKRRKQSSMSPIIKQLTDHLNVKTVNKNNEKIKQSDAAKIKSNLSSLVSRKSKEKRSLSNSNSASDSESSGTRTPARIVEKKEKRVETKEMNSEEKTAEMKQPTPVKQYRKSSKNKSVERHTHSDGSIITKEKHIKNYVDSSTKKSKTPSPLPIPKIKLESKAGGSSSRDSSELSYSPALRNPERYSDILQTTDKQKSDKQSNGNRRDNDQTSRQQSYQSNIGTMNKRNSKDEDIEKEKPTTSRKETDKGREKDRNMSKLAPIVRLHSQSENESNSDSDSERNVDNMNSALNEFQESRRERELKELKMLEHLKSGIAAKAKEKIKTIEKMAANASCNIGGTEVSDIYGYGRRNLRHSLSEYYLVNATANDNKNNDKTSDMKSYSNTSGAIYSQNRHDNKIKQSSMSPTLFTSSEVKIENANNKEDNETRTNCKQSHAITANGHAHSSPTTFNNINSTTTTINNNNIRDKHKREYGREQDKDNHIRDRNYYKRDRDNERGRRSPPQHGLNSSNAGSGIMGNISRRSNVYYRGRISGNNSISNIGGGSGGAGGASHSLLTHNTSISHSQNCGGHGGGPLIPGPYAHSINALNFSRPSRINNTPLITATQFNNQMLCKQSGSVLVGRRNHRTALSLGLSGTPTTNYTNSNLLLTKANALHLQNHYPHSHHHHHQHQHHHHHHNHNSSYNNHTTTEITDRILMAAGLAAHGHHHNPMTYNHNPTTINSLNYLQQHQQQQQQQHRQQQQLQKQDESKIIIKPFKIHDSQPLVAALADSTLVDTIVSKVSTATVKAQEIAARRSRSRSRRSRSHSHHYDRENVEHRSKSHSRSRSSSSSSRSRSRSTRSRSRSRMHSQSSQSSSSSHTSSRSSSSSSSSSRSGGSRSPSIPRHRGSPSFLDRRRITSRYSSYRHHRNRR